MNEGQIYTKDELMQILQVSTSQWNSHNKIILKYLESLCEFEILVDEKDRRKRKYKIIKMLQDFAPYRNSRIVKKEQVEQYYDKEGLKCIKEDSLQTGSNIARNMKNKWGFNIETHERYSRDFTKRKFGTYSKPPTDENKIGYVKDRVWCIYRKGQKHYERMSKEQYEFFKGRYYGLRAESGELENVGNAVSEQEKISERVSREDSYLQSCRDFEEKYGAWPVMANEYEIGQEVPMEVKNRYGIGAWKEE